MDKASQHYHVLPTDRVAEGEGEREDGGEGTGINDNFKCHVTRR